MINLYIYNTINNQLLDIVKGNTTEECNSLANKLGYVHGNIYRSFMFAGIHTERLEQAISEVKNRNLSYVSIRR